MAVNPITTPLPADLPTNWTYGQTVAPAGSDAGLTEQHGYNYLMEQVNAAQEGVNTLGGAFEGLPQLVGGKIPVSELPVGTPNGVAGLDGNGKVPAGQLPAMDYIPTSQKGAAGGVATLNGEGKLVQDIDCGVWDTNPVAEHNAAPIAHTNLLVDGNNAAAVDASESLEEHMANPLAHQNLVIDGNAGQ